MNPLKNVFGDKEKKNSKADLRAKLRYRILGNDRVPRDSAKCFACDCFREYMSM